MGSTQSVLVARHEPTRTVYALERQTGGGGGSLYAMCKLGAWVDVERLAQDATALCADRVFPPVKAEPSPSAPLTTLPPHMHGGSQHRKKRAAIEAIQSLVRKKPKSRPEPQPGPPSEEDPPEVQRRIWDRELQQTPEVMIPFVKQSIEETPVPEVMGPYTGTGEEATNAPQIMNRNFNTREDESPMPEIMIPHPKEGSEVPMPEVMIPCVKPQPEETPAAEVLRSQPQTRIEETQTESLPMGAAATLPSSQIHARAIDDGPQDVATNIFDNIRSHYFEALYKSMVRVLLTKLWSTILTTMQGSLAYFAKGPLSRARSAFHLDLEANLDMIDLIEFLKSLVLTTVQIDKKYRETAPEIIAQLHTIVESSDEARAKKQRRAKKMKLGKNGLYTNEDDRIRKWWHANKPELDEEQPTFTTMQIKSHLSLLRTRETQLQMILILEILALEPLKAAEDAADSSLPVLPGASAAQAHRSPASALTKKRNKHNLPVLVDVHADRLTIWQSTATDEQQLAEDSQVNRHSLNGNQVQKSSSEPLKDFCTDVIVPL